MIQAQTTSTRVFTSSMMQNNSWQTTVDTVPQSSRNALPLTTWLWLLWPPVILVMGTFGNVATLGILTRMGSGHKGGRGGGGWSTMNVYLFALAISDLCVLYAGLLRYWLLEVFGVDLFSWHSALCKLGMWIFGTAWNNSTYLLVALTLQRTFSVLWPHRVQVLCRPGITKAVIGGVLLLSALLLSHVPYGYEVRGGRNGTAPVCGHGSVSYYTFNAEIWVYVEILTFAVFPFLGLILSNAILAWKLAESVREAGRSLTGGGKAADQAVDARAKKMYSTTVTVMVMSFVFLVLNLPLFVVLVINSSYNADAPEEAVEGLEERGDLDYFLQGFITILMLCNSAVNFYLYCLTGTRFRNEMKSCFVCCRSAGTRTQPDRGAGTSGYAETAEEF